MPLISGCELVYMNSAGGLGNLIRYVHNYVLGIVAKAVLAATFARRVTALGSMPTMALVLLAGGTTAVVLARLGERQQLFGGVRG